jgi:hypothetical protein
MVNKVKGHGRPQTSIREKTRENSETSRMVVICRLGENFLSVNLEVLKTEVVDKRASRPDLTDIKPLI